MRPQRHSSGDSCMSVDSEWENVQDAEAFDEVQEQVDFGMLFDVDGVIGRGSYCLDASKKMIRLLQDENGAMRVPIAFVTNACSPSTKKAKLISEWLGIEVLPEQVMHAQSPLSVFNKYHDKHVLVIGQGPLHEMARDLGFTNICTIEDIKESFPLLDMVDHANRVQVATNGYKEKEFPRVEAIVTFGEPNRWETNLQLLIDLLLTNGYPKIAPDGFPDQTLPILACNMDLVFMAEACMPRFGNGSFLICLESLYKKITGRDLKYAALVGKPSEITFRYAEHCLTNQARRMGITKPIKKLYFFGDNPEVDIVGANLYDRYIKSIRDNGNTETDTTIPINSRKIPVEAEFHDQSVESIEAILVETGVYNPATTNLEESNIYHHGHRDFEKDTKLKLPSKFARDVYDGVVYVLENEGFKYQVTG